jgi:hypothetical protein
MLIMIRRIRMTIIIRITKYKINQDAHLEHADPLMGNGPDVGLLGEQCDHRLGPDIPWEENTLKKERLL